MTVSGLDVQAEPRRAELLGELSRLRCRLAELEAEEAARRQACLEQKPIERVGPYRLANRLGSGGMGEVFCAFDERLKRWVAVKHISAEQAGDELVRKRFRREARAAAGLSHPSIVQIHDIVESDSGDWIVMELVSGRSLRTLLLDGPLDIALGLRLAVDVAEGLAEAHRHEIVHRDLKIENIMVTAAGRARILDFGLAKELHPVSEESSLSVQGVILGTVRSLSPEQAAGFEVDHRCDLFSFGTLLYEMFTARSPFRASSPGETLARICSYRQPPVRELRPEVPAELSDLIDRLLEKEPNHRPASATEVVAVLARLKLGLSDSAPAAAEPNDLDEGTTWEDGLEPISLRGRQPSLYPTETLGSLGRLRRRIGARRTDARHTGARRTGVRRIAAAGLLAALVLLTGFATAAWTWRAAVDQEPVERSVAVLGFKNVSRRPDVAWLAPALSVMLVTELARDEQLRIVAGQRLERTKSEEWWSEADTLAGDTLRAMQRSLGVGYVVLGSYIVLGEGANRPIRLDYRLQHTSSGDTLVASSESGRESDLFGLVAAVAGRLQAGIEPSPER